MSKIQNVPHPADELVEAVRSAIEFRGTWFALLFDEMRKAGVDAEGIARRAMRYKKPVIAVVGQSEDSTVSDVFKQGVTAIFPINRRAEDLSISQYISVDNLRYTAENIFRLIKTMQSQHHN